MGHDDQGDEGQGPGDLPDPSTRHWRHPSELGQHGALPHPDPTPLAAGPTGGSATGWPLVAVGGCLAITALVVIGLRTDLGGTNSLQAGTAATVVPTQTTSRTAAASAAADGAISAAVAPSTIERARPAPGDDLSSRPSASGPTTTLDPTDDGHGSTPRSPDGQSSRSTDLLGSRSLGEVASVPVYGVYAAPGRDESQLGSFIMVGGDPVASWSSLDERATVWLRVETNWLEATVMAEDPITDVALLSVVDETNGVVMPTMSLADGPIELGAPAMVGYGDPDSLAGADDDDNGDGDGDGTSRRTTADPESEDEDEDSDDDQEGDTRAWLMASDRRGLIYSLTKPLTTGSDRLIHDPIRLHTVPGPADAGAPLRNRDGEIIGMVAHSTLPQVAAVPIERVVEVVAWLNQTGVGDPAWLGLTVSPTPAGLVVTTIDQGSPGEVLAPGDLIIAVDRQLVYHPDSLEFAAREAGPGEVLDLVVDRKNRRQIIRLQVGTRPLP